MRKEIPQEARRRVPRKTKVTVAVLMCAALLIAVLYKIPFEKTYTATLVQYQSGDTDVGGNLIAVTVTARIQRHFFASPTHTGTVEIGGEVFSVAAGDVVPHLSLFGAAVSSDSFSLTCGKWRGDYFVTRAVAHVEHGEITDVSLYDATGTYAGHYGRLPKNSQ